MKDLLLFLALAGCSLTALAADVTGQWRAEFETRIGLQKNVFDFQLKDGKMSGMATAELGDQKRGVELKATKLLQLLYVSCGNKDGLIRISQGIRTYLQEKHVPHVWQVDDPCPPSTMGSRCAIRSRTDA